MTFMVLLCHANQHMKMAFLKIQNVLRAVTHQLEAEVDAESRIPRVATRHLAVVDMTSGTFREMKSLCVTQLALLCKSSLQVYM